MKKKITIFFGMLLGLVALGTGGCSSGGIWYWGGYAYTRNLQTGEMMKWKYITPEGRVPGLDEHVGMTTCYYGSWRSPKINLSDIKIDCSNINVSCPSIK